MEELRLTTKELEFKRRLAEANNSLHRKIILDETNTRLLEDIESSSGIHNQIKDKANTKCQNTFNKYYNNDNSIEESECCSCASRFKNVFNKINRNNLVYEEFVEQLQPIAKEVISTKPPMDVIEPIEKFRKDYPIDTNTAFIIMQFRDSGFHKQIVEQIKATCKRYGITALRADDKEYADELFTNVKTYMHACNFGIAVFERITEDDINPNVSLEVGYMLGLRKKVCFLKDQSLKSLQTDLAGKLYKPFTIEKINESIDEQLTKWIKDKFIE